MRHCPRRDLAGRLAQALHGEDFFGDADNGVFLAVPRQASELTILRADPKPGHKRPGGPTQISKHR